MVDGAAAAARFSTPYGVVELDGKLIVSDYDNHRLREISLDGSVRTIAGAGTAGFADGAMGAAQFNRPQGLAIANNGDVFVSDTENFRVRRIRGDSVETIAGSGEPGYVDSDDRLASQLYGLEGVGVREDGGMVFVADGGRGENVPYNRIRSIKLD
jgi:DNA-binding beta-propeller fold protein YncE